MTVVRDAAIPTEIDTVRELFREYESAIGIDLCFQGFAAELAALPGKYAWPRGRLLLAIDADTPIGCIALRPLAELGDDACEMKRLYVRPAGRGRGLGRELATRLIREACEAGYRRMLLDTLRTMTEARALYASLGFVEVAPYCHNPLAEAQYLALDLGAAATRAG